MINPSVMHRFMRRGTGVLAVLCSLLAGTATAQEIRIAGTGNALGTMRMLGDAFCKKYPDVRVTVQTSIGSSGAVKAVPRGVLDIGLISRTLTGEEIAAGLVATEYARTPTVLAVSTNSKVTAVTREQLADIYLGTLANWPDGTPIRPVLRQAGDDNTRQIKSLSPTIAKAVAAAEQRPGLPFAVIDQEAAEKIETIPGAIGITTLALIKSEGRQLRPLALDSVEPTVGNGVAGTYPIVKRFFFVTRSASSAAAQQFMAFVSSPAGREILTRTGHWVP